ncbi:MAG: hypothetical protein PHP30_02935 [Bacteroidales bacterium]|nr:hypothetical protein [Bacteroidales bacterium]MDD2425182.1 hypothetical protein [Bacteroidales bacterium]MDD3989036.1 hypothetical protein [Bacteroidales bacterium]
MTRFPIKKTKEEKRAHVIGAAMAATVHLFSLLLLFSTGFRTVYPPPQELGIEIQFDMEPPKPVRVQAGIEPRTEKPDPEKEIRLVQQSQSAITGSKANKGSEATTGDFGDVEQYEAPRPKPIDKRALFPSSSNSDSTAPQVAKRISEDLSAGHPDGNTKTGSTEGEPSARLAGRTVMGTLPEPDYTVNKAGKVVVKISVDQYGAVINATPGATGTTVQDKTLWDAARKAALKAKFNLSSSAPAVQEGTITYIFKLK